MLSGSFDNDRQKAIRDFFQSSGVVDQKDFISKCSRLQELLLIENTKYNLTRIISDFDYWNKHIADSVSIGIFFKDRLLNGIKVSDIGCGAGFPSIVLSIAFPKTQITAIDSIGKKTAFIRLAKEKIGLNNISVVTGRARELKLFGNFDIVTARAVGEPVKIFKESQTWIKKGGSFILYQTPSVKSKIDSLNKACSRYGIHWKISSEFTLPGGESRLFLYSVDN